MSKKARMEPMSVMKPMTVGRKTLTALIQLVRENVKSFR